MILRLSGLAAILIWLAGNGATPPNQPGPNAPAGLRTAWPGYDGSALPAASIRGDARNRFGSNSFGTQASALELVDDPQNPTGSGKSLRIPFPGANNPDWPTVFRPDDFGGQAPARFAMQSDLDADGRAWTELYVRIVYRVSPGFSVLGVKASREVHAQGTATGGSETTLVDDGAAWRKDEHAGRFVQFGQAVRRIASNSSTTLTLANGGRFPYSPKGSAYRIMTFSTGGTGWNAGTKFFFPRLSCSLSGKQGRRLGRPGDNNFVALWKHFDGPVQGLTPQLGIQIGRQWNGLARDLAGLPRWDTNGTFGNFPNVDRPRPYVEGSWVDAEYYFKVNDPGKPNGVYTTWINGTQVYHVTNVMYAPKWVPQQVKEGLDAEECTSPRWSFVWMDPTFGGGLNIPQRDQDVTIRGWFIGGR